MAYEIKLGTAPSKNDVRDAVHVAIFPCIAIKQLVPGQHVDIRGVYAVPDSGRKLGVVDPFRTSDIEAGDMVWVCIYPNSIINLTHHWWHPALAVAAEDNDKWLQEYLANQTKSKPEDEDEDWDESDYDSCAGC